MLQSCVVAQVCHAQAQVRLALEVLFEGVQGVVPDMGSVQASSSSGSGSTANGKAMSAVEVLRVADTLTLTRRPGGGAEAPSVMLEWEGGPIGDVVADAVIAVILQVPGRACSFVHALYPHVVHSQRAQHAAHDRLTG